MNEKRIMDFEGLLAGGDWTVAARALLGLSDEEVAARLAGLAPIQRAQLFSLLPPRRWKAVFPLCNRTIL
ncbi:hypothetical protein [Alkalilimnicola ehrlichii]|uniref:hypothetical protein n=1 Tax=Alkalilimnicola ehrlichii TaxID=351052 RepID=UPI0011C05E66|nr:hypothetical protein [Alkalilimnicola ehrlichii]